MSPHAPPQPPGRAPRPLPGASRVEADARAAERNARAKSSTRASSGDRAAFASVGISRPTLPDVRSDSPGMRAPARETPVLLYRPRRLELETCGGFESGPARRLATRRRRWGCGEPPGGAEQLARHHPRPHRRVDGLIEGDRVHVAPTTRSAQTKALEPPRHCGCGTDLDHAPTRSHTEPSNSGNAMAAASALCAALPPAASTTAARPWPAAPISTWQPATSAANVARSQDDADRQKPRAGPWRPVSAKGPAPRPA